MFAILTLGCSGDCAGACFHLDGRVQGGMQLRWWFGILFGVLADFRKIDGWVSWGVLFGVFARLTAGFCLGVLQGGVLLEVLVCKYCYMGSMLV